MDNAGDSLATRTPDLSGELPPPIEVVASWSILPSEQVYPRSKGCSIPRYTNYMANFSSLVFTTF